MTEKISREEFNYICSELESIKRNKKQLDPMNPFCQRMLGNDQVKLERLIARLEKAALSFKSEYQLVPVPSDAGPVSRSF